MPGKESHEDLALDIAVAKQQITVDEQSSNLQTSPESNAGAIVIKDKDLDALSDDPDQLQDELNALAGRLPALTAVRFILMALPEGSSRRNLPSAKCASIKIRSPRSTINWAMAGSRFSPSLARTNCMLLVNGNDSAFNSLNTFVSSEPAYYSTFLLGNVSGSFNSRTSWFFSGFRRDNPGEFDHQRAVAHYRRPNL
jgi:hypothetical protein